VAVVKPANSPNLTLTVKFENEIKAIATNILMGPPELPGGNDKLENVLDSIEVYKEVLDEIAKVGHNPMLCAFY
jgi:hypothetical protein